MIKIILKITITILLFVSSMVNAQNFQGKAIYQTKIKMGDAFKKRLDSSKMPEDRKAFMLKMIKSRMERVYELDFNKKASIYKEQKKLETPSETKSFSRTSNDVLFKNTKEKIFANKKETFGKIFLIKDSLQQLNWKLGKASKMIGKHLCFKATAMKKEKTRFGRFGKSSKKIKDSTANENKKTKLTKVVAWYAPDIPVNHGPADYYGLPGLILEINAGNFQVLCTKIVLNPEEKVEIIAPKKGKEVTQKQYDEIVEKKVAEMREQYKSNRKKDNLSRRHRRF